MTAIRRRTKSPTTPTPSAIDMAAVREFLQAREDQLAAKRTMDRVKPVLDDFVQAHGYDGPDGHIYFDLPERVGKFGALQRRRNVSKPYLDPERASDILHTRDCWEESTQVTLTVNGEAATRIEQVLREAGLWEEVLHREEQISEERVLAFHALHPDRLALDDIFEMQTVDEKWAFWPVESSVVTDG